MDLLSRLTAFNQRRFAVRVPDASWKTNIDEDFELIKKEIDWIETRRLELKPITSEVPREAAAFLRWFEGLKETGPGQGDPLFPWLSQKANFSEMQWFIHQEVAGEAGFDDLLAHTQVKMPNQVKLEMARNFWDEMGRGKESGMHGPMLERTAKELRIHEIDAPHIPETLELANLMSALAFHRMYAYQSVGALGAIELTAPTRAVYVYQGLKRLMVSASGCQYFLLHGTLDVKHSEDWNREVIYPLVKSRPEVAEFIAEGALLRLFAGEKCFKAYHQHFKNSFIPAVRDLEAE